MGKNLEKSLKRFLKRKLKITTGVIVSFMIIGNLSFASEKMNIYIDSDNGVYNNESEGISKDAQDVEYSTQTGIVAGININEGNNNKIDIEIGGKLYLSPYYNGDTELIEMENSNGNEIYISAGQVQGYAGKRGSDLILEDSHNNKITVDVLNNKNSDVEGNGYIGLQYISVGDYTDDTKNNVVDLLAKNLEIKGYVMSQTSGNELGNNVTNLVGTESVYIKELLNENNIININDYERGKNSVVNIGNLDIDRNSQNNFYGKTITIDNLENFTLGRMNIYAKDMVNINSDITLNFANDYAGKLEEKNLSFNILRYDEDDKLAVNLKTVTVNKIPLSLYGEDFEDLEEIETEDTSNMKIEGDSISIEKLVNNSGNVEIGDKKSLGINIGSNEVTTGIENVNVFSDIQIINLYVLSQLEAKTEMGQYLIEVAKKQWKNFEQNIKESEYSLRGNIKLNGENINIIGKDYGFLGVTSSNADITGKNILISGEKGIVVQNSVALDWIVKEITATIKESGELTGITLTEEECIEILERYTDIVNSYKNSNSNDGVTNIFGSEFVKIEAGKEALEVIGDENKRATINIGSTNGDKSGVIYISGQGATKENIPNTSEELQLYSTVKASEGTINLTGDRIIIDSKNTVYGNFTPTDKNEYVAVLADKNGKIELNGSTSIYSPNGIALYSRNLDSKDDINKTDGSSIILNEEGNHQIFGDIVVGKNSVIDIKGSGNYIGKYTKDKGIKDIEVLVTNGGKLNLDLTDGTLIGRVDDYYEAKVSDNGLDDNIFRDNKFYADITSGGTANLTMNDNSTWIAKGQSFVSNINYDEEEKNSTNDNFGTIDLSTEGGTSMNIKNLGSGGEFKVKLNSDAARGEDVDTDMIYIKNITSDNTVINISTEDAIYLENGQKLRFATVGEKTDDNFNDSVVFKVNEVKEKGIKNVSFSVEKEDYDTNKIDENSIYNGETTEIGKPGNEFVDKEYAEGENHYLTKNEESNPGGDGDVNDIGRTIIEVARSNYANAVYMDNLNKRLGDMSFANGDEGVWVRIRTDRVGEDEYYRLHNNMVQLGYDKTYPMEEGIEHRGLAFEYGRGELEFKDLIGGENKSNRYILTLYDTRVRNNGVYTDYTLRGGAISTDFSVYGRETNSEVNGSFKNMLLGAGAEVGKRFDIDKNWYFEPQLQAQYTYIDSTDYTTNQGTRVDLDEIHSLIGRVGFRLGHDFYKENTKDNTIYLKADVNHEFLGDENISAKDITGSLDKEYKNDGTWYDVGMGLAKNITPDFNVYMDVEKQFGPHRDSDSWQTNIGFRYRFNSVKELNPIVMFRDFAIKSNSYFNFDSSELKPEGKEAVQKIASELKNHEGEGTLKIEGHTDYIGTREYNQKLSERRAKSVEDEFRKNISEDKIKYDTKGYGEDRPIADNSTKEGRAKNRRVEIDFEGKFKN